MKMFNATIYYDQYELTLDKIKYLTLFNAQIEKVKKLQCETQKYFFLLRAYIAIFKVGLVAQYTIQRSW